MKIHEAIEVAKRTGRRFKRAGDRRWREIEKDNVDVEALTADDWMIEDAPEGSITFETVVKTVGGETRGYILAQELQNYRGMNVKITVEPIIEVLPTAIHPMGVPPTPKGGA